MPRRPTRRHFLETAAATGTILGLGEWAALGTLSPATADEADVTPDIVRFGPDLEPIVRLISRLRTWLRPQRLLHPLGQSTDVRPANHRAPAAHVLGAGRLQGDAARLPEQTADTGPEGIAAGRGQGGRGVARRRRGLGPGAGGASRCRPGPHPGGGASAGTVAALRGARPLLHRAPGYFYSSRRFREDIETSFKTRARSAGWFRPTPRASR
jgi:hypothetical protein